MPLPLREECQRLASGLPRLDPPLPGNLCTADEVRTGAADAGISDDEQSYSLFHDEDKLERELEVHERRLLGSDAGPSALTTPVACRASSQNQRTIRYAQGG